MPTNTESNQLEGAKPAIGFGPNRGGDFSQEDYHHPAAGWGAAISVSKVLITQGELIDGTRAGDYSSQSDQPLMKHVVVEIKPSEIKLYETNQMLKDRNAGYAGESTGYENASTQIGFLRS
jgi:hypothetical protein